MRDEDKTKGQLIQEVKELRRQTQEELSRSSALFSRIMETSPAGIVVLDRHGTILSANPQATGILGLAGDQIAGRTYNDPQWRITDYEGNPFPDGKLPFRQVMDTRRAVYDVQHAIEWPEGRRVLLTINAAPLLDESGQVERVVTTVEDVTPRVKIERDLRRSRKEWEEIFQAIGHATIIVDTDHTIIAVNRAAVKAVGKSEKEIIGKKYYEVFHGAGQPPTGCPMEKLLASGSTETVKMEMEALGGVFLVFCTPILDEQSNPQGIIHIATDITARKRAEDALRENEEKYRSLSQEFQAILNAIPDAVCLLSPDLRIVWANEAMAVEIDRSTISEVLGCHCYQVRHHRSQPCADCPVLKCFRSGKIEHKEVDPHGRIWELRAIPICDDRHELRWAIEVAREITERRSAEEALRQSEEKYRTIIETTGTGYVVVNQDGEVLDANQEYVKFTGHDRIEEIRGRRVTEWTAAYDLERNAAEVRKCAKKGFTRNLEIDLVSPNGKITPIEINATAIRNKKGQVILALCRDITERRQAEQTLRESEERLKLVIEGSQQGFWDWNLETDEVKRNERWAEMLGYTLPEIDSSVRQWLDLVHPDDQAAAWKSLQDHLAGRTPVHEIEYRMLTKNQQYKWVLDRGRIVERDAQGRPRRMSGTHTDITGRKQVEEASREAHQKLQALVQASPLSIFVLDPEGKVLLWNPASEMTFGWTEDEVVGRVLPIVPEDKQDEFRENLRRELAGESLRGVELRRLKKDGTPIDISVYTSTLYDAQGEVTGVLILDADITERKRAEELLKLNELRLETLLKLNQMTEAPLSEIAHFAMEEATLLTGSEIGYIAFMNEDESVLTMHAWSKTAMAECRINDKPLLYPVETTGLWGEAVRQRRPIITNDYGAANPWKKGYPEGHVTILRHMNVPIFDGEKIVIVAGVGNKASDYDESDVRQLTLLMEGMWRIVQRTQAEEALQESEEKYRLLVGQVPAVVYKGYTNWSLDCFDRKIEAITGYAKEDFDSRRITWLDLIFPEDIEPARTVFKEALEGDGFYVTEHRIRKKTGEVRWIQARNRIIYDAAERVDYISGVFFDITERKLLEDQLINAQRMEAVGILAGGMAHDFNNLLTAIMGYSEIMMMELRQEDPFHLYADEITKAAQRGASLTNQLLAFSRKQILQPQVINLNEVVIDMDKMLQRLIGEDIELITFIDQDLGFVKADPAQIGQIIMNLAVNARDAMPDGGNLTIETANVSLGQDYARSHVDVTPGPYVMLAVSDNGAGMDAETMAHIFEPFFTTKESGKGTGLGLATVYGIVKQSGGNIWVYSEPGQGTTFKVYLPRVEESLEIARPKAAPVTSLQGDETILLVEDDAGLRDLVSTALRKYGFKVLEATHGGEALLICEKEKSPIHLMLTDVVMPQISGSALAERLRLIHPEMKVLFMSGYTENSIVHHGVLNSQVNFIQKPFRVLSLVRKVREVLDSFQEEKSPN